MTGDTADAARLEDEIRTAAADRLSALRRFDDATSATTSGVRQAAAHGRLGFSDVERLTGQSSKTVAAILRHPEPRDEGLDVDAVLASVDDAIAVRDAARGDYEVAVERLAAALAAGRAGGLAVARMAALADVMRPTVYAMLDGRVNLDPARDRSARSRPRAPSWSVVSRTDLDAASHGMLADVLELLVDGSARPPSPIRVVKHVTRTDGTPCGQLALLHDSSEPWVECSRCGRVPATVEDDSTSHAALSDAPRRGSAG